MPPATPATADASPARRRVLSETNRSIAEQRERSPKNKANFNEKVYLLDHWTMGGMFFRPTAEPSEISEDGRAIARGRLVSPESSRSGRAASGEGTSGFSFWEGGTMNVYNRTFLGPAEVLLRKT